MTRGHNLGFSDIAMQVLFCMATLNKNSSAHIKTSKKSSEQITIKTQTYIHLFYIGDWVSI